MNRSLFLAVLAPLLACTPFSSTSASTPIDALDTGVTAVEAPASTTLSYTDVLGGERSIQVELRLPDEAAAQPMPVVVWSHGGGRGKRSTTTVGARWGRAFNQAGLAFVAIAHVGREDDDRLRVCDAVGASDCSMFSSLRWDRPHDIAAAIDWIESIAPERGLDARRVALGGHSGGALGVLNTMGLVWEYDSELHPAVDDRPIAVLAASPPGASTRHIDHDALAALRVPMIWLTGAGDSTRSTLADDRRASFDMLTPEHSAVLFWAEREEIRHGGYNLDVASCRRAGGVRQPCREAVRTIADLGVSFIERSLSTNRPFDVDRFVATAQPAVPAWGDLERAG